MSFRHEYLRQLPHLTPATAEAAALQLFQYQAAHCPPYAAYLAALGCQPAQVGRVADVPFLPIEFFKTHDVRTDPAAWEPQEVFRSSGTTLQQRRKFFAAAVPPCSSAAATSCASPSCTATMPPASSRLPTAR